jgi:hypothetical protein
VLAADLLMCCRWAVGLTFLASVAGKARDLAAFRRAVVRFGIPAPGPVAVGTVAAELAVVATLAAGLLPVGFGLAIGLLVLFSVLLGRTVRTSDRVSCNCFGAGDRPVSRYDLVRNLLLAAVAVLGLALGDQPTPPAAAIVLVGLMAGWFVLMATDLGDIVELFINRPSGEA